MQTDSLDIISSYTLDTNFLLLLMYSVIIGSIEKNIIRRMTHSKFSFTNGMFPKKNPPNTNKATQKMPPITL